MTYAEMVAVAFRRLLAAEVLRYAGVECRSYAGRGDAERCELGSRVLGAWDRRIR